MALCDVIDPNGYIYIAPNGPIPVLGPHVPVGEWWASSSTWPQNTIGFAWSEPGSDNQSQLLKSEHLLEDLFQEVTALHNGSYGNCLLLGFSQGGSMTYKCGLKHPELFTGVVCLSSGIQNIDDIKNILPPERTQPVFIAHGVHDNPTRGREAATFLSSEGYATTYKEYEMAHEITGDVIKDLSPWIHSVLPPAKQ